MSDVTQVADEIRAGVSEELPAWQDARGADEDFNPHLVEDVGQLLVVFTELLWSTAPLEGFSREGAIRALVEGISSQQHEAGRDAVS